MKKLEEDTKTLDALARELAINHLRHSLLSNEVETVDCYNKILDDKYPLKPSHILTRTIFVVGAGASTNACYNIFPPGPKAIDLIEKYFDKSDWPEGILEKSEKIKALINLPKMEDSNDFETRLFSLSHFFKAADVQEAIKHIYNHRTFPSLFYEILAHLLKNRYIDGIINFNFDELLDQAVEEEVGMGQLHKILSDGDCLDYKDMLVDNKLTVPFYIKPHGTVSHKSSLLFTKEHYVNLSSDLENLLEEILTGQPLRSEGISPQFQQLNIVIAGFQMESIEFNKVLQRSIKCLRKNEIEVKIIYLSYLDDPSNCKDVEDRLKKMYGDGVTIETPILKNFKVSKHRSTGLESYLEGRYLDHFGLNLIDATIENYRAEYFPGDINRHIGLISFFQQKISGANKSYNYNDFRKKSNDKFLDRKREMHFETKEYYLERTIFEIINVVLKNNGVIQPKESLKGINRVGIYFNLYVRKHRKNDSDKGNNLSSETTAKELSFYDILHTLQLKSKIGKNSKEIFERSIDGFAHISFQNIMDRWIKDVECLRSNDFYKKHNHLKKLLSICIECLSNFKFSHEKIFFYTTKDKTRLNRKNAGDSLLTSESINLYPNYNDVQLNIISKIDSKNIVATNLELTYRYKSMFLEDRNTWRRLHIVSDSGLATLKAIRDAVENGVIYNEKKIIYVILSDMRFKDDLLNISDKIQNFNIKFFQMPFYDHSRHMALFTSDELHHSKALYYYKKGYSNNINAVHLEGISNKGNMNMLFHNFKQYLAKSIVFGENFESSNGVRYLPYFKDENQINKIIQSVSQDVLDTEDKEHFRLFDASNIRP